MNGEQNTLFAETVERSDTPAISSNAMLPACHASCVDSSNSFFYEGAEHVFLFINLNHKVCKQN